MKVYVPLLKGVPVKNYFPIASEHYVCFLDKTLTEKYNTESTANVLELDLDCTFVDTDNAYCEAYHIKALTAYQGCHFLELKTVHSASSVRLLHGEAFRKVALVIRPLYSKFCQQHIWRATTPSEGLSGLQFEKEMETNTDKEVLIPISLYESLVNQACSQE